VIFIDIDPRAVLAASLGFVIRHGESFQSAKIQLPGYRKTPPKAAGGTRKLL